MDILQSILPITGVSAAAPSDQHTSFSIGYNIGLAAQSMGMDVNYHLAWNMGHGSNEGSSAGTFYRLDR